MFISFTIGGCKNQWLEWHDAKNISEFENEHISAIRLATDSIVNFSEANGKYVHNRNYSSHTGSIIGVSDSGKAYDVLLTNISQVQTDDSGGSSDVPWLFIMISGVVVSALYATEILRLGHL
jgi:hypothetical protein